MNARVLVPASFVLLFLSIGAFLGFATAVDGDANHKDASAQNYDEDPASLQALLADPPNYLESCRRQAPSPITNVGVTSDVRAAVQCSPKSADARTVAIYALPSADAVRAWAREWQDFYGNVRGTCIRGEGRTAWIDRDGERAGDLICAAAGTGDIPDTGRWSRVIWTDEARRRAYVAVSSDNSVDTLARWWSADVRTTPRDRSDGVRRLRQFLRPKVDLAASGCKSGSDEPEAVAELRCRTLVTANGERPPADTLFVARFKDREALAVHMERYAYAYASRATSSDCKGFGFSRSSWSKPDGRRGGELVCFPAGEEQYLAWTDEEAMVFGQISRTRGNGGQVMKAWEAMP